MPIMAVTAYAAKGDEERIREAGAEGYVSKPISVVRFVEAVQALLAAPRPEAAETGAVRVTRRNRARPEAVFDAWLDAPTASKWLFATPDGEMVRFEIDARVGGRYEIVERRGGEDVRHIGVYERIERPRRLAFTLQVPNYSGNSDRVTIEVEPADSGSELRLTQGVSPGAAASPDQIERGWGKVLDGLAAAVDGKGEER